ncbi:serine/threonine-protein phosphatase 6 regulatory ankyrin repeat subunit C-like isoform X1 [Schistocerca serialis cubense]|uniref:serine/threonine-protein phosphatase 6 regulatory ankyrin repeat subunit C-like isoform X1 n=1 Tax=Schistocerca serialis cubense TaxID=2023355 RepID=UPI00214EFE21|nr:serine/threonine-protein phosphatase 6 regulatory ankyrin repeat subunit C-like isoform X1 [Schistocerca serialis cubense]
MSAAAEVQRTAAVDLGALLDAGDGAVVTLVAGGTRLAAHRAVLEERSPVFRAMFQHDTLEASCGEVRITDVEGPVLRQLLSYMYTLQAPQLTDTARELLTAADRYGLSALKAACEQQVAAQLEVETAAAAAVLAVRHSCPSLTAAAVHFIRAHDYKAMATQGWADAVLEYPKDIVEVSRLLGEPPAEASAGRGSSRPSPATRPLGDPGRSPAAAARHTPPPPDDAAVSRLRSLSQQERGRRLIEAAEQGAVEQLRELLAAGADVGAREEQWGSSWTALHWAAGRGHVAAASCLVGAGAEVDARTSLEQQTPLHWAAVSGHAGVVRLLVAASADLNARDRLGQTPLHLAAEEGHAGAAAELLLAGADRGARDKDGWTPLYLARERGNQELVDMLTQR